VLFPNRRTVVGRVGHPLAAVTSLGSLCNADWATTSITVNAEHELGVIFEKHKLPPPKLALRAQSALTLMTCLAHTDLLAMVPVQWTEFAPMRELLVRIPVQEELAAPPIVMIKRADLPLTPAATYLLDLMRRASASIAKPAITDQGKRSGRRKQVADRFDQRYRS